MKYCGQCGHRVGPGRFCPNCGFEIRAEAAADATVESAPVTADATMERTAAPTAEQPASPPQAPPISPPPGPPAGAPTVPPPVPGGPTVPPPTATTARYPLFADERASDPAPIDEGPTDNGIASAPEASPTIERPVGTHRAAAPGAAETTSPAAADVTRKRMSAVREPEAPTPQPLAGLLREPTPESAPESTHEPVVDPAETAEMTAVRPLRVPGDTAQRPQLPPLAETAVHPAAPVETVSTAPAPVLDREDGGALAPEPDPYQESRSAAPSDEPSAWVVSLWVLIVFLVAILVAGVFLLSR